MTSTATVAPMATADRSLVNGEPFGLRPHLVILGLLSKRLGRSGALWGYVFGAYALSSLYGYAATYKTQAARDQLAHSFGANLGINALIGPARVINTVPGFVAWRALGVLSIVGAVWGLLTATRVMRGDEEAGRWELLLVGRTTRRRGAAQAALGLATAVVALFTVTAAISVVMGHVEHARIGAPAALFFALALVSSTAVFMAVGAFTSQLASTRRRASWMASGVFGVSYALRMVADSNPAVHWLVWLSPLGWIEQLHPLTGTDLLPLAPILVLTFALVTGAVVVAGERDAGEGLLADHDTARARTALLGGPTGLAVRLVRSVSIGWMAAVAAFSVLIGMVAVSASSAIGTSRQVTDFLRNLGLHGSLVKTYLGLTFLMVALIVVFLAAAQAAAVRAEEAEGHVDVLLVRPVSRTRWLAGRLAVASGVLVVSGALAGLCAWAGAESQHTHLAVGTMLDAGLNIVPGGVFVLGLGVLTFGSWPRRTSAVVYGYVSWSFLLEFIGGAIHLDHWVMDTSVLFHLAPSPAMGPDWAANAALAGLGAAMAVLGSLLFRRRDLQAE